MRALIRASLITLAVYAPLAVQADTDYPFATHEVVRLSVPDRQVLDGTLEAVNRSTVSAVDRLQRAIENLAVRHAGGGQPQYSVGADQRHGHRDQL